jgi:pheromone shutdown protein TraB
MYQWVMNHYNFVPGKEFLAAAEAARELKVPIVLGDRQVAITVKRIWMGLTGWQKAKLISGFIFGSSSGEEMSTEEDDLDRLLQDRSLIAKEMNKLAELSPWLVECLVHERDKFMVLELEQVRVALTLAVSHTLVVRTFLCIYFFNSLTVVIR